MFELVLVLIIFSILVSCVFDAQSKNKAEEEKRIKRELELKQELELARKIQYFTKQEFVRGCNKTKDFGWIRVIGESTRRQLETSLKVKAARKGANAIIKFSWQSERQAYQAGTGKKGNPYYKNRTVYDGEAVAILLDTPVQSSSSSIRKPAEKNKAYASSNKKPMFKRHLSKKIILDGNNIVGRSAWSFNPLTLFMEKLTEADYEYTLFFDNNIYRTLKELDLISENETIIKSISRTIGVEEKFIVVTPAGTESDPFILELARQQNAAIISNNRYNDFTETYFSVVNDNLLNFEVVGETILVPKLP